MAEARNYCRWIMNYFGPYLGRRVVEVGAGTGTFSELLLRGERTEELVLFEAAQNLFPLLCQRFTDCNVRLHCSPFQPSVLDGPADSIVLVNVLEHIPEDSVILSQIYGALRPGGSVLLFVPALSWNFGTLDKAFGHCRRYNKRVLGRKLREAHLRVEQMRYINVLGIASWFFAGRVLRQSTLRSAQVRWYDRWIIPWSFKLERICEPPLGQSLLAVALK